MNDYILNEYILDQGECKVSHFENQNLLGISLVGIDDYIDLELKSILDLEMHKVNIRQVPGIYNLVIHGNIYKCIFLDYVSNVNGSEIMLKIIVKNNIVYGC